VLPPLSKAERNFEKEFRGSGKTLIECGVTDRDKKRKYSRWLILVKYTGKTSKYKSNGEDSE
jgi:hypothetical protein